MPAFSSMADEIPGRKMFIPPYPRELAPRFQIPLRAGIRFPHTDPVHTDHPELWTGGGRQGGGGWGTPLKKRSATRSGSKLRLGLPEVKDGDGPSFAHFAAADCPGITANCDITLKAFG